MVSTGSYRKGFGLFISVVTALIAVVTLFSGKHHVRRGNTTRYEGWYDSLGI
ncbi:MAG TPA: hypothetical protein VMF88_02085 [Bacteroidota bacterium]|nr:hypothetical protein [Bacteroidota bacterium]